MYKPLLECLTIKPSSIHGNGLFATTDIPKGTILGISHIHHDLFPDGWIRTPLGGFTNHSETPNCKLVTDTMDEGFLTEIKLLQTTEDIKKDTELTCTYTIWKATPEMKDTTKWTISNRYGHLHTPVRSKDLEVRNLEFEFNFPVVSIFTSHR